MIPLVHDLEGKSVVVFGGGELGTHKAELFEEEAEVHVVGDRFSKELEELDVSLVRATLTGGEDVSEVLDSIDDVYLVMAATGDPELDGLISEVARERGALVNRVDGPIEDVITPSIIDEYPLLVAVSTRGNSPATSKYLRKKLEPLLERARGMVELQSELREELKGDPAKDELLWRVMENSEVWKALAEDPERARDIALKVIEKDE